jgi:hypothetical protein
VAGGLYCICLDSLGTEVCSQSRYVAGWLGIFLLVRQGMDYCLAVNA